MKKIRLENKKNEMYRIQTAGDVPAISSIDTVAVFNCETGIVVHLHEIVAFEGAKTKSAEQSQEEALQYAAQLGHSERISTLFLPKFQANALAYKVNLKTQKMKAIALPTDFVGKK
jgi:hypothetical protein